MDSKREKVKKAESEEEKQERRFRGVWFSCFSFLSKGVSRENIITGEGDFSFFFLNGERVSRE